MTGVLRVLCVVTLIAISAGCTTEAPTAQTPVARGEYLVNGVARCFWCHSPLDDGDPAYPKPEFLGSGDVLDPKLPTVAGNLTTDHETGLGSWTDEEIIRAVREGKGRDGRTLRVHPSAYYSVMTDDDAAAVVAYLRSLPPIRNALPASARSDAPRDSVQTVVEPASADMRSAPPLVRGAYLTQLGECLGCHTPTNRDGHPATEMQFGGGRRFYVANGFGNDVSPDPAFTDSPQLTVDGAPIVASANITQSPSGIPYYTEHVFVQTIRTGHVASVRRLSSAMPWIFFRNMSDEDLRAVFAYLQTVPPVNHNVSNVEPPTFCAQCGRWHGLGTANDEN